MKTKTFINDIWQPDFEHLGMKPISKDEMKNTINKKTQKK